MIHLLLVEDRIADADLILYTLKNAGIVFTHTRVDNKKDYLLALQKMPDLIICDYALPDFDGLHALSSLKAQRMEIPFILVSGTIGEEKAVEAMKLGANDYIMKDKLNRLPNAVSRELQEAKIKQHSIKSTFTHHLTEELLPPTQIIMEFSKLLATGQVGILNQEQEKCCQTIYNHANTLLSLLNKNQN